MARLDGVAGDKILSLTINAGGLSPATLRKILDSASAHPVRLDVQRVAAESPSKVLTPAGVDVDLHGGDVGVNGLGRRVDAATTPPSGYVKVVGSPSGIGPGVHVPRRSLDADVEVQPPAASVDLAAPVEDGGVSVDLGDKGLMAELDKMFQVDQEDPSSAFDGPQLHAAVNAEMDSKLELPSAKMELDDNAVSDADEDVIVSVTAPKVKSEPPTGDIEFSTPEVEIGTARIADVNADKDLHLGDGELNIRLPDIPERKQDIEVKGPGAEVDIEGPSVAAAVDVPQLHVHHDKPATDVDVDVKDGKKKSKFRLPFKSKSKKKNGEAKVESPTATLEISPPIPVVGAADAKVQADIEPIKAEQSLPGVQLMAANVEVEGSSAEVSAPSVSVDGKAPDIDGVGVTVKPPVVDGGLEVKADKDIGDVVAASADVPQLHANHSKPAADVDLDVKDGKKKSKLRFPFKSKSKKNGAEAKAEMPSVAVEISPPLPTVETDKANVSVDASPELSGDLSAAKPEAAATVDADVGVKLVGGKISSRSSSSSSSSRRSSQDVGV